MWKLLLDTLFTIFNQTESHYLQTVVERVKIMIQIFIYPEGTSLDTRKDESDEDHIKSFVSFSDDKGKKEKKSRDQSISFRNVSLRKENMGKSHIELIFKHSDVYIVKVLK